jgi:hypothetical protein
MEMYDTNKDGVLSREELANSPALRAALDRIDVGGKGTITAADIAARIQAWQMSKLGRISVGCTVLRNGRPLADAEVKFVPEKFLGESMPTASGKTDSSGVATISVPTSGERDDPPGVPPGLYLVEVTKAGDNIPAKYNTHTTLGQEVARDTWGMREGIRFDLQ